MMYDDLGPLRTCDPVFELGKVEWLFSLGILDDQSGILVSAARSADAECCAAGIPL